MWQLLYTLHNTFVSYDTSCPLHMLVDTSWPLYILVDTSCPLHMLVDTSWPLHILVDTSCPLHILVDTSCPLHMLIDTSWPLYILVDTSCPLYIRVDTSWHIHIPYERQLLLPASTEINGCRQVTLFTRVLPLLCVSHSLNAYRCLHVYYRHYVSPIVWMLTDVYTCITATMCVSSILQTGTACLQMLTSAKWRVTPIWRVLMARPWTSKAPASTHCPDSQWTATLRHKSCVRSTDQARVQRRPHSHVVDRLHTDRLYWPHV